MDIRPILSTLRRHKVTAFLLIMEIALTCAIICNAIFLIDQRLERMRITSGIAEHELVYVQMAYIGARPDAMARTAADLAVLRGIAGVTSVTLTNQIPFGGSSSNMGVRTDLMQQKDTINASQYLGEDVLPTLGAQLLEGRDFRPDEYRDLSDIYVALSKGDMNALPKPALITRAVADQLWPGQEPLGKQMYVGGGISLTVIGVVAKLIRPNQFGMSEQYSVINPVRMDMSQGTAYVIRCAPQDREQVLKSALIKLKDLDPNRIVLAKAHWISCVRIISRTTAPWQGFWSAYVLRYSSSRRLASWDLPASGWRSAIEASACVARWALRAETFCVISKPRISC